MEGSPSSEEEHEHKHVYAVHVGRLPGIYTSWVDCHAQITSWSGGSAWAYNSIVEAKQSLDNDDQVKETLYYPRITYKCDRNTSEHGTSFPPCVDEQGFDNSLLEYNMCAWLSQITNKFNLQNPNYEMLGFVENNDTTLYRYKVTIMNPIDGKLMASVGKFATSHELAQQQASIGILRRLQTFFRKVIIDFNYHNIKLLKTQIELLNDRLNHLKSVSTITDLGRNDMLHFTDPEGEREILFVDEEEMSTDHLLTFSMQHWLEEYAGSRRLEPPRYTLQKRITQNRTRYYRYYVALNFRVIGRPPVTMGRFASCDHLAREDAAATMLRRLQSSMGRSIIDFNYYKINSMEDEVAKLTCDISACIQERFGS